MDNTEKYNRHVRISTRQILAAQFALEQFASKWFMLVVERLSTGKKRYGELRRSIPGVSQRMLTRTLRQMERDGFVWRVVYPALPPKTEYSLTSLGSTLLEPLQTLCRWAGQYRLQISRNRKRSSLMAAGVRIEKSGNRNDVRALGAAGKARNPLASRAMP
jgi:DNA-binding HxlR family transcriptional regulator